jgi:predicted transcriptional regulator
MKELAETRRTKPAQPIPAKRQSAVAKVSHTLSVELAERLESFAFFQRVSESAVIEHSLKSFFDRSDDDAMLGDELRRSGAGRRR